MSHRVEDEYRDRFVWLMKSQCSLWEQAEWSRLEDEFAAMSTSLRHRSWDSAVAEGLISAETMKGLTPADRGF